MNIDAYHISYPHRKTIDYIKQTYGTIDRYLDAINFLNSDREKLREVFLEPIEEVQQQQQQNQPNNTNQETSQQS